ncbi:MAG: hypothetical protein WBP93_15340 [Pyrinomonadaceae bacterium]
MDKVLVIVLIFASIWDGFTTIYGTLQILGTEWVSIIAALLFGALILSFLLNTRRIMSWESDFTGGFLKLFWVISISYDLFTAWTGNQTFIIGETTEPKKIILLAGLTLMISGSPVVLSLLWEKFIKEL